jgi:hypothetical protein
LLGLALLAGCGSTKSANPDASVKQSLRRELSAELPIVV